MKLVNIKKTVVNIGGSFILLLSLFGVVTTAQAAVIKTDIVMIVDESGSMGSVQTNLRNNIGLFASTLTAGGVDANFALVGYGNSAVVPRVLTDFTSASDFAVAAGNLVASGGTEPAFDASGFALNQPLVNYGAIAVEANLSFRTDAVSNLILFTDEDSNGDRDFDASGVDSLLKQANALFNVVLDFAYPELVDLAVNNGGQMFDLSLMNSTDQTVVEQFVTDFANEKLQETLDFCATNPNDPACQNVSVPEPAVVILFGAGILLLMRVRRH